MLCLLFLLKWHMACYISLLSVLFTWATSTKGRAGISHLNKLLLTGTDKLGVEKPFFSSELWCYQSGILRLSSFTIYISWHLTKNQGWEITGSEWQLWWPTVRKTPERQSFLATKLKPILKWMYQFTHSVHLTTVVEISSGNLYE